MSRENARGLEVVAGRGNWGMGSAGGPSLKGGVAGCAGTGWAIFGHVCVFVLPSAGILL